MLPSKRFAATSWALLAYTVLVVLGGAYVRATLSGDGCGAHWPLCNGEILPVEPSQKTIIELSHRVTSGIAGFWALGMWIAAFFLFPSGHASRRAAAWSVFFMVTEALIGAGLVRFEMVASNPSNARAFLMAGHLLNTFLLLASLSWLAASATRGDDAAWPAPGRARVLFVGAAICIGFVGVSGAVAALGDTLFPAPDLRTALLQDLSPTAHIFVRLRFWHPILALLASAYLIGLAGFMIRTSPPGSLGWLPAALIALVVLQIAIGLLNVALLAPVWMQLVHLLVADATWIAVVLLALSSQPAISDARLEA